MRRRAGLALLVVVGVAVGMTGAGTYAAFTDSTSNAGNTFSADTDWVPPTVSASVILRVGSSTPGVISQGSSFDVFANVSDPSGVASISADVSAVTTGATAVALSTTGGPWMVGGTSYAWRTSSAVTANASLPAGAKAYSITATDGHSPANTGTTAGFSVTVDNSAPAASDIQTANNATIVGQMEAGDTITYTYTEQMNPSSILAGWNGSATAVQVDVSNGCGSEQIAITGTTLGTVCTNGNYVNGNRTFSATMTQAGASIVVTLTAVSNTRQENTPAQLQWTPSSSATDMAGNPCSATAISESVPPNDVEF